MTPAERHYTLLFRSERPDKGYMRCLWDARRHIHFMERLKADLDEHKRRSRAAKKAWKKRKENAQ